MQTFNIGEASYRIEYANPKPNAKYGLAYTFWYSNMVDLVFSLEYIDKTWINKEFIDISICSYADIPDEYIDRVKPIVSYIVKAEQDFSKLNGTTCHVNGALKVLLKNPLIKTVAHSDCDVSFLNQSYFFGLSNMLYDSGKVVLTSQDTYLYDMDTMKSSIYDGHDIDQTQQFGSTFILNSKRALQAGYHSFPLKGHFERDRYTHFIDCGLSIEKDAIIIPRVPFDTDIPSNFLYSFDFHMGIVHNSGNLEFPETEDRKLRLLKLMGVERWEDMPLGWKWNYNPKSPRPNYRRVNPPQENT